MTLSSTPILDKIILLLLLICFMINSKPNIEQLVSDTDNTKFIYERVSSNSEIISIILSILAVIFSFGKLVLSFKQLVFSKINAHDNNDNDKDKDKSNSNGNIYINILFSICFFITSVCILVTNPIIAVGESFKPTIFLTKDLSDCEIAKESLSYMYDINTINMIVAGTFTFMICIFIIVEIYNLIFKMN